MNWLSPGKTAAVVVTLDDLAPHKQEHGADFGGNGESGQLRFLQRLLKEVPWLRITGFVIPDTTFAGHNPTRRWIKHLPKSMQDRVWASKPIWPGTYQLDKFPEFARLLNSVPRMEYALHGLHHAHRGLLAGHEYQSQSWRSIQQNLAEGCCILTRSGLKWVRGFCPPYFATPPNLVAALEHMGFDYLMSSRDLFTEVRQDAKSNMSGLKNVDLYRPQLLRNGLVHIPTNFQATSTRQRAFDIIEVGGLLSVKIHMSKITFGYTALDGLDDLYVNYLSSLFHELRYRYGNSIWWTTPQELARQTRFHAHEPQSLENLVRVSGQ